jgi:chromosome segregation ATPase
MSKLIVVLLAIVLSVISGCGPSAFMVQTNRAYDQLQAEYIDWNRDLANCKDGFKSNLAELDRILGQENALLRTFADDNQIQPAVFQLYKDFLVYVQPSDDKIKIYEFIEKIRASLPADKMETIEALNHQFEQNEAEYGNLQGQKAALGERLNELNRRRQELGHDIDQHQLLESIRDS